MTGSALGVSVLAAGTLVQLVGGTAAAATHPASNAGHGQHASREATSAATPATARPDGGCTEDADPSYGCGKLTAYAVPVAATYPTGETPDLSDLILDLTGSTAANDTVYTGVETSCGTLTNPNDGTTHCYESSGADAQDPANPSNSIPGTWVAGAGYTVAVETTGTDKAIPADTLMPAITGTFPDCTAYQESESIEEYGFSGCSDRANLLAYGTYHHIAAVITSSVTHKRVANATYELCSATAASPVTGKKGCPAGSAKAATATTNSKGVLVFPSAYLGSANYSIAPTKAPKGYRLGVSQHLNVPVVTTVAQAGTTITTTATMTPIKTVLATHSVQTTEGKKVSINALSGAKDAVKPLTLVSLGKAKHGTVHHSGGTVSYTP
jgi:hypothetical protein